jgi:hypothetical protein
MSMEEKKEFEVPEVTSYDREELDLKVAVTGTVDQQSDPATG